MAQRSIGAEPDWQAAWEALPLHANDALAPMSEDWLIATASQPAVVARGAQPNQIVLDNGLLRRSFQLSPNAATIGLDQLSSGESMLRAIRPEAKVTIDQVEYRVGGLTGQPIENYLLPEWTSTLVADPESFQFVTFRSGPIQARFDWKPRSEWMSRQPAWPAPGVELVLQFRHPRQEIWVDVHYELYQGLPLLCKWLTVTNRHTQPITVNHFTSEILACVEASSEVEEMVRPPVPRLHVETDYTKVSMGGASAQRDTVHWIADPSYKTQVNYLLKTPCLLECRPPAGPNRQLNAGESVSSFRTWILAHDSSDSERQTLALCRMYRTIAPWVDENPWIMHVRSAEPEAVRLAIDQAAAVDFDLVIMTFGSGFNLENESPAYLQQLKELADYAHEHGVALGGYSLLGSRSIDAANDVINPETGKPGGFAAFGNSPCLCSRWGEEYFRKLKSFYEVTGCDVLEHDGSYPGDVCASTEHPGHRGLEDSRWNQWEKITANYRWCRGRGIYLNVPDWYFLHGSSKTGMGYRETNWSLPRAQQELIERQNILDGTRFKTPSMGWMFVPLTEYHGGGPAATIEPLDEHRDHYARRLYNLAGAGVQACFRGPRLYDTPATQEVVQQAVKFYRTHQEILNSDLIPLRRADGRDWDGWLHVHPAGRVRALAMIYNPLDQPLQRTLKLPLYYAGARGSIWLSVAGKAAAEYPLDDQHRATVTVDLPALGHVVIVEDPPGSP